MDNFKTTIGRLANDIQTVAPALAGLVLIIIGLMYMLASDAQKKQTVKDWAIRVAVGFLLVYLAAGLVTWFKGKISGAA